jgi:hypothetical protein
MTDQVSDGGEAAQPWWHGAADGMPDIEALLGEEGMAAVGTVADEALKLFVVMRERFAAPPAGDAAGAAEPGSQPVGGSPWEEMLGQLAAGAVRAVNDLAAGAQAMGAAAQEDASGPQPEESSEPMVQPGEAAACAYCPVCQAIALFRSVPMTTWQRLAASVVEVADAARDVTGAASPQSGPVVVAPAEPAADAGSVSVSDVLANLAAPEQGENESD